MKLFIDKYLRSLLLFVLFLSYQLTTGQVTSNFSTNDEGWTVFDANAGASNTPVYTSTGGNPGGEITFTTSSGSVNFFWTAPAKFTGDFSHAYKQNLTFDLRQSTAGTDNSIGDVILSSSYGISLFYQVATKPSSTGWSSYSVPLIETAGWKMGCATCAAATQAQMKQVLYSMTKLQIRMKYLAGNTGPYSGQLDNVVLNVASTVPPPTITSFTPSSAVPGATITINGTNFNTSPVQNNVKFNGVQATVLSASATVLTVKLPTSAPYGPIMVTNLSTGLTARSAAAFNTLFDNNKDYGGQIISNSMSRGYYTMLPMANNSNPNGGILQGDFDGDGWIDIVVTETATNKIFAYRNLGTGGVVSSASFAAPVTLPSIAGIPGGGPNLGTTVVADFDSDGKLDIAACSSSNTSGYFSLFHNSSTSGTISFDPAQFFAYAYYSSQNILAVGDLDADGRPDLVTTTGTSPGNIWIAQNLSSPGTIDFGFGGPISGASTGGHSDLLIADLNGDKKPEIISPGGNSAAIAIYENTSTPGVISMNAPFTYTTIVTSNTKVTAADLDGDGKQDLIWSGYGITNVYIGQNVYNGSVFDATSLAASFTIPTKTGNPAGLTASDINADGKPDIAIMGSTDAGIIQNIYSSGALSASSFLPGCFIQCTSDSQAIFGLGPLVADLDGDNKPEMIAVYSNSSITTADKGIFIFHNESYPVPAVTSFSPASGATGTSVALTGDFMNTGNAIPVVRVGSLLSNITGTSNTSVSATIPTGSTADRITVTEHGLTAISKPFNVSFATSRTINTASFGPSVDFALSFNPHDALAVADWDDDGRPDVSVIDNSGLRIFQNTQTGQPITTSSLTLSGTAYTGSYDMIALDIDGDGKIDLNNGYGLLQNNGTPGTISFLSGPSGIYTNASGFTSAAGNDFNKDGKIDLATITGFAGVELYDNVSTRGTFEYTGSGVSTFGSAISFPKPDGNGGIVANDFDGDGYVDVAATNQSGTISTFLNTKQLGPLSASTLQAAVNITTSGSQPVDITTSDFDGDGKPDIAVTYFNSPFVSVYRNTSVAGVITFASPVNLTVLNKGYKITAQDLDGDGIAEIIVIHQPNPGPGSFSILQNKSTSGTISFGTAVNYPISRNPQAIAIADINQDQKPDILIVANAGSPANALMVFENKITTGPVITISPQPADATVCDGSTATFTTGGSGTTNITYQWQFATASIGPFTDITNGGGYSGATTSTLSVNTTGNFGAGRYRCKIGGDLATPVLTTDEGLFINPVPSAPTTTGATKCSASTFTLNAAGGANGQYRWYTVQSGGTAIAGQVNSACVTPVISSTTTYYVSIEVGSCESSRTPVVATVALLAKPVLSFNPSVTGNNANLCTGQSQTMTAPPGFETYAWSNGSNQQQIVVTQSGVYSVIVSDDSGCSSQPSDAINVTLSPYPQALITLSDVNLTASAGDRYQWYVGGQSIPDATSQSLEISLLEYGVYAVDVTTAGCTTHSADFIYLVTETENQLSGITAYPNPVDGDLNVAMPGSGAQYTLQMIDLMGREINIRVSETSFGKKISTMDLKAGTYFLILQSTASKRYFKILKQ